MTTATPETFPYDLSGRHQRTLGAASKESGASGVGLVFAAPGRGAVFERPYHWRIRKGVELLADPARQAVLDNWLHADLPAYFSGRILPVDLRVCDRWGRMLAAAGRPLPAIDSLLAATAVEHNLILVTRNAKDFISLPVPTIDPWSAP